MQTAKNWLFVGTGTLLTTAGLLGALHTSRWVRSAEHAVGRVVREEHGPAHTIVEFVARDGSTQSYNQNGIVALHKGEQIDVLYHQNSPRDACVNRWPALYTGSIFALAIGTAHLVGGLFGVYSSRKSS